MKKILPGVGMALTVLILLVFAVSTLASEDIYGLKIENINRNGADFYWSTSIETKGSIEYAYTKLPELYNPQLPGSSQTVLITVTPVQTRSEEHYRKEHHIKIDNLDVDYCPFVQYTTKSETFNGDIYTLSGEFVLVDTKAIDWWQTWEFAVFMPLTMFVLGHITREKVLRLWKYLRMHTPFTG
jgi:hypothetical protein